MMKDNDLITMLLNMQELVNVLRADLTAALKAADAPLCGT